MEEAYIDFIFCSNILITPNFFPLKTLQHAELFPNYCSLIT